MYQINIKWLLVIAAELFRGNVITNLIMPVSRSPRCYQNTGLDVVATENSLVDDDDADCGGANPITSALVRKLDY